MKYSISYYPTKICAQSTQSINTRSAKNDDDNEKLSKNILCTFHPAFSVSCRPPRSRSYEGKTYLCLFSILLRHNFSSFSYLC